MKNVMYVEKYSVHGYMILLLTAIFAFSGCASPAKSMNMVPSGYEIAKRHDHSVTLEVSGGAAPSIWTPGKITSEAFLDALEEAVRKSGIFSPIVNNRESEYLLEVRLTALPYADAGGTMEVFLSAIWQLKDLKSEKTIWREVISSPYTATVSDAFSGMTRARIACEGSARLNIESGIRQLSTLDLN